MAGPVPIVRQLIICDRLKVDRDGTYTLIHPRVDFVARSAGEFPLLLPELWVFAQITGSYGRHDFQLSLFDVTDPTVPPELQFDRPPRAIDLGRGPGRYRVRSRGWAVKLTDVELPAPGRYELRMRFGTGPGVGVEIVVEDES